MVFSMLISPIGPANREKKPKNNTRKITGSFPRRQKLLSSFCSIAITSFLFYRLIAHKSMGFYICFYHFYYKCFFVLRKAIGFVSHP